MFKVFAKVTKQLDKLPEIQKSLSDLSKKKVYIGVPEGDVGSHEGITNAQLLYVQTHGVRSKEMREEMNDYMGITPGGMPIMRDFQKFSSNLGKGMPYSAAYEMFIHEHGSPLWQIPPRPVLEPAIEDSKDIIAKQLKVAIQAALNGGDGSTELAKAGQLGVNASRAWFTNPKNRWAANAPSTIKAKGSDKPLIDTGQLRTSIQYIIAIPTGKEM